MGRLIIIAWLFPLPVYTPFDKAKNLTDVIFMMQKFDSTKTKAEQLGWRRANLKQYESCGDR